MTKHGQNHWIKLYVAINDDPKIMILPINARWRFISSLALAGEQNEDGFLPPFDDELAFRLRTEMETLHAEMRMLATRGLAELRMHPDGDERWFLPKFADRQKPSTNAERQQQWRKRNAGITKGYAEVTTENRIQNTETEGGAHGRTPTQEPAMYSQAHPAIKAMQEVTTYWPGEVTHPIIIEKLGDTPDIKTLGRAYQLWMTNGNKPTNYAGICDWYQELRRDPTWTPQARFKGRQPTAAAPDEENIWTRTIAAIKSGKLPADAALAKAIKAVGWSRLQEANQYNERQVREELVREYRNAITAAA